MHLLQSQSEGLNYITHINSVAPGLENKFNTSSHHYLLSFYCMPVASLNAMQISLWNVSSKNLQATLGKASSKYQLVLFCGRDK